MSNIQLFFQMFKIRAKTIFTVVTGLSYQRIYLKINMLSYKIMYTILLYVLSF